MSFLDVGPADARAALLLAHGAGAGMASPFMVSIAGLLAERGVRTLRFEFAYMRARSAGGSRRPPPKAETMLGEYAEAVAAARAALVPGQRLFIGGKSMGGRIASLLLAAEAGTGAAGVSGLVCLGYPFHPPAKPEQLRLEHLSRVRAGMLVVQGERDPFGNRAEVESWLAAGALPAAICWHWAGDGDHDFGPRGGKGFTRKGNLSAAADTIAAFVAL